MQYQNKFPSILFFLSSEYMIYDWVFNHYRPLAKRGDIMQQVIN